MTEQEINTAELYHENRQLRAVINDLLYELDSDPGNSIDVDRLRKRAPDRPDGPSDAVGPPWEREGYESKQAWLEDKRDGQ